MNIKALPLFAEEIVKMLARNPMTYEEICKALPNEDPAEVLRILRRLDGSVIKKGGRAPPAKNTTYRKNYWTLI